MGPQQRGREGFNTGVLHHSPGERFLRALRSGKARFRTYLRRCVDGYVANEIKSAGRLKRGGGSEFLSLDCARIECEIALAGNSSGARIEDYFEKEFVRNLFDVALGELRKRCEEAGKQVHFRLFERYYLNDDPGEEELTYRALAAEFKIPVTAATNYLAFARGEARRIVLEKLREITGSEEEFNREARAVLGVVFP